MARTGERKQQKRMSVEKAVNTPRKSINWIIRVNSGGSPKENSLALAFIVRDVLGLARSMKEAKIILNSGSVLVNGIQRSEPKFSVGILDIVETKFEGKDTFYRVVADSKGRLCLKGTSDAKDNIKLCKVAKKKTIKGGRIQVTTTDGLVFVSPAVNAKVGGEANSRQRLGNSQGVGSGASFDQALQKAKVDACLKIKFPEKKILEVLGMEKGSTAYIISGKNAAAVAKIIGVSEGTMKREKLVELEVDDKKIMTVASKVIVIGKGKPEIILGVEE